jgi:hypothetical protein
MCLPGSTLYVQGILSYPFFDPVSVQQGWGPVQLCWGLAGINKSAHLHPPLVVLTYPVTIQEVSAQCYASNWSLSRLQTMILEPPMCAPLQVLTDRAFLATPKTMLGG